MRTKLFHIHCYFKCANIQKLITQFSLLSGISTQNIRNIYKLYIYILFTFTSFLHSYTQNIYIHSHIQETKNKRKQHIHKQHIYSNTGKNNKLYKLFSMDIKLTTRPTNTNSHIAHKISFYICSVQLLLHIHIMMYVYVYIFLGGQNQYTSVYTAYNIVLCTYMKSSSMRRNSLKFSRNFVTVLCGSTGNSYCATKRCAFQHRFSFISNEIVSRVSFLLFSSSLKNNCFFFVHCRVVFLLILFRGVFDVNGSLVIYIEKKPNCIPIYYKKDIAS